MNLEVGLKSTYLTQDIQGYPPTTFLDTDTITRTYAGFLTCLVKIRCKPVLTESEPLFLSIRPTVSR